MNIYPLFINSPLVLGKIHDCCYAQTGENIMIYEYCDLNTSSNTEQNRKKTRKQPQAILACPKSKLN